MACAQSSVRRSMATTIRAIPVRWYGVRCSKARMCRRTCSLSLVTECSKWGLFTRPLTQNWGRGRIELIGDAAHAMLPNAGQGACQAFEDAYILARWLEACADPVEAFTNFRRIRIPRVHGVQRLSLSNARFKHMRDSAAQRESIAAGKGSVHGNSDWVWGYDPIGGWDKEPFVPTAYAA